ncbi:MAG: hypothetical protein ACKVJ3_07695 [bacterium]|jgi:hypothetical protein
MKTINEKGKKMGKKNFAKYELRYEIASERNKIAGYTLIPESNRVAEAQHMSEHEAFQAIQRHALKGESEEVHKLLLEFPEFKREDLKKMLVRSVETHGKTLEL